MGWATIGWVLGLLAGSVVLTRLYVGSGRSVLLVALWHTAFNFTTATTATQGLSAAITSTAVVVAAVVVLVRARARERAEQQAPARPLQPRVALGWRARRGRGTRAGRRLTTGAAPKRVPRPHRARQRRFVAFSPCASS